MDIPGSSKCVKRVPFHQKKLPKGRNFTYLEDPRMYILLMYVHLLMGFSVVEDGSSHILP